VSWDGGSAEPSQVMGPPRSGLAVGYVVDTRPTPELPGFMQGVDLLICEGTFADPAQADRAVERKHMLFAEAADIAHEAGAGQLWLTHFSPALGQPEGWATEAAARFERTTVGTDGLSTTLNFAD
jgi:ribonuclease Z